MKQTLQVFILILITTGLINAQYSETFDLPNKGVLNGPCTSNDPTTCASFDFAGVNWTIEGNFSGIGDGDNQFATESGVLRAVDVDEELCWVSPVLTMTGTASFSMDLSWIGFDDYDDGAIGSKDYIDVAYRIDGGSWITLPNAVGGGPRTISYIGMGINNDGSLTGFGVGGLTGNTLQIRVCVDVNSTQESVNIDNVAAVNADDGAEPLVCDIDNYTVLAVDEDCTGFNNGSITVSATTSNGPISYSISGPVSLTNSTGVFTGLPPGMYTVTAHDQSFVPGTCTETSMVTLVVGTDTTPPTATAPADVTVDCPEDIDDPDINLVTNVDDNCLRPCFTEPWINEFHYDNIGTDVNEFIEVAGPAGLDLSIYSLYVYDGFNGAFYGVYNLSGTIPDQQNGYGASFILTPNLQNQTEGIALVKNGTEVIEFISYEGVFTATNGPAIGLTSVDVGVAESNDTTPADGSIGRVGSGNRPGDFNFAILTQTQGNFNTGQTITSCPENVPTVIFLSDVDNGGTGTPGDPFIVTRTYRVTDANNNTTDIIQTLTANGCCEPPTVTASAQATPVCPGEDAVFSISGTASALVNYNINGGTEESLYLDDMGDAVITITGALSNQTLNLLSAEDTTENCLILLSQSITIIVEDTDEPMTVCRDTTLYLNEMGHASVLATEIDNGSTDNCGIQSYSLSQNTFACSDTGSNIITLFVTDVNNNTGDCTSTITVLDTIPPAAICKDTTLYLDEMGLLAVVAADIDNGSSDNCGIDTMYVIPDLFSCTEIGENLVEMWVIDESSNSSSCIATITVLDTLPPEAICTDLAVSLNSDGLAVITTTQIDAGSFDNCEISTFSLSETEFNCEDVGFNTVILTVTDVNGNTGTCTSLVEVEDLLSPTAECRPFTVYLDENGQGEVTADDVDNGSTDNCDIQTLSVSTELFTCMDVGTTFITLTVTDVNGNSSFCSAFITILDTIPPQAICRDTTLYLDEMGTLTVSALDIDNGSNDNCGIDTMYVIPQIFSCSGVGTNLIELWVTDVNANSSSCTATLTVLDSIPPTAICLNVAVSLNENGLAEITPEQIDIGSFDNCSIETLALSETEFTCEDVGFNLVILTVTDVNGNTGTCTSIVEVEDLSQPVAECKPYTVYLDENGQGEVTPEDVDDDSNDNCGIQNLSVSRSLFTCEDIGTTFITLTVTDVNGNSSFCSAFITVLDTLPPQAICKDTTLYVTENGGVIILAQDIDGGSDDNCGVESLSVEPNVIVCSDLGPNTITLTVIDVNSNSSFCTATVTVLDSIPPLAICENLSVYLDEDGEVFVSAEEIDGGSIDNCEVDLITISKTDFTCEDVGPNFVVLTVTDVSGNAGSCSATITVMDTIPPVVACFDITVSFNGETEIFMEDVDLIETGDNCEIESVVYSPSLVTVAQIGDTITVTVTVTDVNGNSSQCTAEVFVSGLPDGWTQNEDGVNCAGGNFVEYDPVTEEFIITSTNCFYANPFNSDQLAYAQRNLCGDGMLTAEVKSITGGLGWAGLVMRENNDAGAKKIQLITNLSNFSRREVRVVTNGSAQVQQFPTLNRYWLRLIRQGNQFSGYVSQNGTNWFFIMAANIIMDPCIQMGLVTTNYNSNSTVVATFANVSYTGSNVPPQNIVSGNPGLFAVNDFELFPNPATQQVWLDLRGFGGQKTEIEIMDINGRIIHRQEADNVPGDVLFIDLINVNPGMYLVRVTGEGQPGVVKRMVVTPR